jgi:hypothetical protein
MLLIAYVAGEDPEDSQVVVKGFLITRRLGQCLYVLGTNPKAYEDDPYLLTLTQWYSKDAYSTPVMIDQVCYIVTPTLDVSTSSMNECAMYVCHRAVWGMYNDE